MDLRADGQLATFYGDNPEMGRSYDRAEGGIYHLDALPVQLQRLLVERRKQPVVPAVEVPEGFSDFAESNELLREAVGWWKAEAAATRQASIWRASFATSGTASMMPGGR